MGGPERAMEIKERRVDGVTILDTNGRMTRNDGYGTVKERVGKLLEQGHKSILVNLSDVPYMDSTCVGELVSAFITVRNKGGRLKLYGATGRIKDLFTIAKLDSVFDVFDTEAAAIGSFSRS